MGMMNQGGMQGGMPGQPGAGGMPAAGGMPGQQPMMMDPAMM